MRRDGITCIIKERWQAPQQLTSSCSLTATRLAPGFARLVAEITMGQVREVLGLMSRLTRAGRDRHELIELCSLARCTRRRGPWSSTGSRSRCGGGRPRSARHR